MGSISYWLMGYYPQSFNKMRRNDTPIERINSKINSLPYKILFLGYVDGWKTFETTKIKLKDVEFNSEEEIMYSSFVRSGWKCKLRRQNDIKIKRLPLVKSNIEKKIDEIKQKEKINLEFIDFVEDCSPNDVITDEVRIILRDIDYNETGDINYFQFMFRGWKCNSLIIKNQSLTIDQVMSNINDRLKLSKDLGINLKFLGFDKEWVGVVESRVIIEDTDYNEISTLEYSSFIRKGCTCKARRIDNSHKIKITKEDGIKNINDKIAEINKISNIAFIGFKNDEWIGSKTKLILENLSTSERNEINYCDFLYAGWYGLYKNEGLCKQYLQKYLKPGTNIEKQKSFYINDNNICNQTSLRVDYYIESENLIVEYDGQQHYEYCEFMQKTYSRFIDQVNRDNYLVQYCKDNNIRLLRISYKDNNRLEEVIKAFLVDGIDISIKVEPKLLPVPITYYKSNYGR